MSSSGRLEILRTIGLGVSGAILLTLVGCDRFSKEDIAANSPLWGGYTQGVIYELKQSVFLLELEDQNEGTRYALSPEGAFSHPNRFYTVPGSIEKYRREAGKLSEADLVTGRNYQLPTYTVDVINAGVRVKCASLVKYKKWTWFFGQATWAAVYGEIQDGPHAGTLVDITDLSTRNEAKIQSEEIAVYQPDPRLLSPRAQ